MLGTDGKISTTPPESTNDPSESAQKPPEPAKVAPESAGVALPTSAHRASTHGSDRWAYGWFDRRPKIMSVLPPVAFILALELVPYRTQPHAQPTPTSPAS